MNNGNELSASRQAAVAQAAQYYQEISAERDQARAEAARLKSEIAAHKVTAEAMSSQLTQMESRMMSLQIARDQAVAERAVYETLFITVQAQFKALKIPAAPLIRKLVVDGIEDAAG